METIKIIKVDETLSKYNGKPAIKLRVLDVNKNVLEQTYNLNSTSCQKLLKKSLSKGFKGLEGIEVEATIVHKKNKAGKLWKYLYF